MNSRMRRRLAWVLLASQLVPLLVVASCTSAVVTPAFAVQHKDTK